MKIIRYLVACVVMLSLSVVFVPSTQSFEFGLEKIEPNVAYQGQSLTVSFIGFGFDKNTGVGFMPPFGINITSVRFVSDKQMNADLTVDKTAPTGSRDAIVSSSDGQIARLPLSFTVLSGTPPEPEPEPQPKPVLLVKGIDPDRIVQGQTVQARIFGIGFDEDAHICFCHSLAIQPQSVAPSKKCGDVKHKQFIETFSKEKDSTGCHTIVITKKCYVGTCVSESGHKEKHNYSWVPCKDPAHATKPTTEKFCTTDEAKDRRNKRYNDLVDQQSAESKEKTGISVEHLVNSDETLLTCSLSASAETIATGYDLAVMGADGTRVVLRNALKVLEKPMEPEPLPETSVESLEVGDGYFRVKGTSLESLASSDWIKLPVDANLKPDMDNWHVPPAMADMTICYAAEKVVFAGNGKVVSIKWSEFMPSARIPQTKDVQVTFHYKLGYGDVEILCQYTIASGESESVWHYCLTHVTIP